MPEITEKNTKTSQEIQKPRRFFVEVGTNEIPVMVMGEKKFGPEDTYIGIDLMMAKDAKQKTELFGKQPSNYLFITAQGERLPLKGETADELYFGNVFGDPSIPAGAKNKFLQEARRALKKDGLLIVKETNTPLDLNEMKELLRKNMFQAEKIVTPRDADWAEATAPYDVVSTRGDFVDKYSFLFLAKATH